jgi:hypothetical protein
MATADQLSAGRTVEAMSKDNASSMCRRCESTDVFVTLVEAFIHLANQQHSRTSSNSKDLSLPN